MVTPYTSTEEINWKIQENNYYNRISEKKISGFLHLLLDLWSLQDKIYIVGKSEVCALPWFIREARTATRQTLQKVQICMWSSPTFA